MAAAQAPHDWRRTCQDVQQLTLDPHAVRLLSYRDRGTQSALDVGADHIVYRSDKGASRTWRSRDIESLSASGPFTLTFATFKRAPLDYGGRKDFNFQLKEPLREARYNELWRRIHQKEQP